MIEVIVLLSALSVLFYLSTGLAVFVIGAVALVAFLRARP